MYGAVRHGQRERARLPGKERTAQGVWEGISQYLCPQRGWTPALPAPGMLIIWVSCLFHCSKLIDWYQQLKLHFFMGQFGVVATSQELRHFGGRVQSGLCHLEGPGNATLTIKGTLMSHRPSHHVNSISKCFVRAFLLCFVFSCCRSTNFLGPIRVTAAKA